MKNDDLKEMSLANLKVMKDFLTKFSSMSYLQRLKIIQNLNKLIEKKKCEEYDE